MRFAPKTEQELQMMSLIEPGTYAFQVINAANETSKSGNDMIKLTLNFWDKDGNPHTVFDYLLEVMAYKLRHFCDATGLIDKYERGEIHPSDCIGKEGYLELVVQEGKIKDNGDRYPSRNSVKDYVKKSSNKTNEFFDDDIPNF